MKKSAFLLLVVTISLTKSSFSQQIEKADSLGLPGDNLNLYAVLDLFQKSETFEVFEKKLNSEDSKVNNLDLNNDGKIDYIKVIDHQTGESHAVVLQVPVNEKETQDVAVIEIDKDKNGKILVQIVGDEELYGKDYIVEPTENDPTAKTETSDTGKEKTVINNTTNNYYTNSPDTYVVVDQWPIVHYVYTPAYVVYVSPWYWYSYPAWWSPWSPWFWHDYYWHHYPYYHYHHYGYYHRTTYYRAPGAHGYYGPRRSSSKIVQQNRTAKVYHKTYISENRAGEGKMKPGTSNPGYKNKPENNISKPDSRQKPNNEMNKPNSKPRENSPAPKVEKNKPTNNINKSSPQQRNKPANKPVNKPAQRQGGQSGNKSGGGKKR